MNEPICVIHCRGCGQPMLAPAEIAFRATLQPERYEAACYDCAKALAEAYARAVLVSKILNVVRMVAA